MESTGRPGQKLNLSKIVGWEDIEMAHQNPLLAMLRDMQKEMDGFH